MASLRVAPFSAERREDCARLLADRFERQRAAERLLPQVDAFSDHVPDASGAVATRDGEVVAYVAGTVQDGAATVGFGGCAASDPEAIRDCFAAAAAGWGVRRFSVAVPASDADLVDAWFRLAFGCQFVWAVRETGNVDEVPFDGTIRAGTADDLEAAASFDRLLCDLQAGAPSFSGREVPGLDELREEWRGTWDDPLRLTHVVAERDGQPVGHVLLYRRPDGDLRVPSRNIDLAHAATLEAVRGTGVGLALTAHVLRLAAADGYESMTIDWRSVNLLASRFWPRRGFRPQYLRLYRVVP